MKRGLLFIGLFLILVSMYSISAMCTGDDPCSSYVTLDECVAAGCGWIQIGPPPRIADDNVIMWLSSPTNAHGEVYSGSHYLTSIRYENIFGSLYAGTPTRTWSDSSFPERPYTNFVVELTDRSNAHAGAQEGGYIHEGVERIYYGDLACTYTTEACNALNDDPSHDFRCVVQLSSISNAHLAVCGTGYDYKICCTSPSAGAVDCTSYTANTSCLATPDCTWTPPRKERGSDPYTAGCCPAEWRWDYESQQCVGTANLCTTHVNTFSITQKEAGFTRDEGYGPGIDAPGRQYCAKISSDLSYGFWYPTEAY